MHDDISITKMNKFNIDFVFKMMDFNLLSNITKNQTTEVLKLIPLSLRYFMMNLKHLESFPINSGGYTPLWLNKPSVRSLTAEVQVYPVLLAIDDVLVFLQNSSYKSILIYLKLFSIIILITVNSSSFFSRCHCSCSS